MVNFVNEKDEITIKEIKQKIEERSASADVPEYKWIVFYPRLPVKYKSSLWSARIARKVLKYMDVTVDLFSDSNDWNA